MPNPFFSVIVPVYKVEQYLEQCVESVLSQSFQNFQLILVDDGSPDNCPKICDRYAAGDPRIEVIHKKNGGLSEARNYGLDAARGDYILFLDSDDFWCDSQCLQSVHKQLIETGADVLIFGMKKYYQNENRYADVRIPRTVHCGLPFDTTMMELMRNNAFVACACDKVIRRSLITENRMTFVVGQLSEDIEWCAKLLLCRPSITVLGTVCYTYRQQNANSITASIGVKNLRHVAEIVDRYSDIAEKAKNTVLYHYIANQYVLWLTVSNLVPAADQRDLLSLMKKRWYLVQYDAYPYMKRVRQFRFFGFFGVRLLLKIYYEAR